jgi:type IV pilus assembly protein PilF
VNPGPDPTPSSRPKPRPPAARHTLALALCLLLGACISANKPYNNNVKRPQPADTDNSLAASSYNVQLGMAYIQQGDLAIAQDKLNRALRENPRDPKVHAALGLLEERLGDPRKADDHYRDALRLAPQDPFIENNYAVFLCSQGRTDEGVKRFEDAAHNAIYPTPEAAFTNAGVCLRKAKRYPLAEQNLLQALARKADYQEALLQLGELYLETSRLPEAHERIERYLANFPETAEILWLGVRVARAAGDRLTAERYARKLRLDFPNSDETRRLADLGRGS